MPDFAFLARVPVDTSLTARKFEVLRALGHPYSDEQIANAVEDAREEARAIAESLRRDGIALDDTAAESEMVALIAYMQSLGRALREAPVAAAGGGL